MLSVPVTLEGLPVVTELISQRIHANVTLLFSVQREQKSSTLMTGLEKRLEKGVGSGPHSVASFFVSRVDSRPRSDGRPGEGRLAMAAPCGA